MTREEVIRFLGQLQRILIDSNSWKSVKQVIRESFTMAIEALEADVPDTNVGDTISRQAALDALCKRCDLVSDDEPCTEECNDIKILKLLPSAQPERKKGKWRLADIQNPNDKANGNYLYFCSNCFHADLHAKTQVVPYCWYCGAEMEVEG